MAIGTQPHVHDTGATTQRPAPLRLHPLDRLVLADVAQAAAALATERRVGDGHPLSPQALNEAANALVTAAGDLMRTATADALRAVDSGTALTWEAADRNSARAEALIKRAELTPTPLPDDLVALREAEEAFRAAAQRGTDERLAFADALLQVANSLQARGAVIDGPSSETLEHSITALSDVVVHQSEMTLIVEDCISTEFETIAHGTFGTGQTGVYVSDPATVGFISSIAQRTDAVVSDLGTPGHVPAVALRDRIVPIVQQRLEQAIALIEAAPARLLDLERAGPALDRAIETLTAERVAAQQPLTFVEQVTAVMGELEDTEQRRGVDPAAMVAQARNVLWSVANGFAVGDHDQRLQGVATALGQSQDRLKEAVALRRAELATLPEPVAERQFRDAVKDLCVKANEALPPRPFGFANGSMRGYEPNDRNIEAAIEATVRAVQEEVRSSRPPEAAPVR